MTEEIEAAVAWWAQTIHGATQDNDDMMQSGLAAMVAATYPRLTDDQVERFSKALRVLLRERLTESWQEAIDKGLPHWGSAARSLNVDYGPDQMLADAADAGGFAGRDLYFPMKTHMRIDPGIVEVGCGYRAPFVVIYEEAK